MESAKALLGLIVIWVEPVPVTWLLVTSIVSTTESSDALYMTTLPVSTSTASEKLRTILLVVATAVASSAGENEEIVGAVSSAVVKLRVVVSLIPE